MFFDFTSADMFLKYEQICRVYCLRFFLGLNMDMLSRILNLLCSRGLFNFKKMKSISLLIRNVIRVTFRDNKFDVLLAMAVVLNTSVLLADDSCWFSETVFQSLPCILDTCHICDLCACLSGSIFQQLSNPLHCFLLTSLWVCSSSQDWKAQLKLPPVDARYKTEVRIKFVEASEEILSEECGHLKLISLHMMMGKRYLVTCTPLVYKSVW